MTEAEHTKLLISGDRQLLAGNLRIGVVDRKGSSMQKCASINNEIYVLSFENNDDFYSDKNVYITYYYIHYNNA